MKIRNWLAAAGCLIAVAAQAAPAPRWTVVDLGPSFNPAFGGVAGRSLNDRGEVAGWAYYGQSVPMHHAFVWDNGNLTDLGVPAGTFETNANAINNHGTVVGSAGRSAAFYKDGVWTVLGVNGELTAVNDHDTMVGSYQTPTSSPAFMVKNGAFFDLGTLGGSFALPLSVNDKGVVAGWSYLRASVTRHGFIYENGAMRDVGTLGGLNSELHQVNDHGVAAGTSEDASGRTAAVIYDGTLRAIPGLGAYSFAVSINDHGDVLGYSDGHMFLYQDGTLTFLDQLPEVVASGWHFQNPVAINNRGWIVVYGYRNNTSGTALLIPK